MNNKFDELAKSVVQSVTRRRALKKFGASLAGMALACVVLASSGHSAEPGFTTIDFPDSVFTIAAGINSRGDIVGRYVDSARMHHGFLLSGGVFTSMDIPGAELTRPVDINDNGDIVGHFNLLAGGHDHGFLLRDGELTVIDVPGSEETTAGGINRHGDIAGYYRDANHKWHGFVLRDGVFTTIDYPRAKFTEAWRINDAGQVVGRYTDRDGTFHLYRLTGSQFESFDFPGAVETAPGGYSHLGGLNNLGDIASAYASGSPFQNLYNPKSYGNVHGLLMSGGSFSSIDPPAAVQTIAIDVNDGGQIVGAYIDATGGTHGYLRTP